jgi:hypothetical protein
MLIRKDIVYSKTPTTVNGYFTSVNNYYVFGIKVASIAQWVK